MQQALSGIEGGFSGAAVSPASTRAQLMPFAAILRIQWNSLAARPLEANGFLDPGFVLSSAAHARNGAGGQALTAYSAQGLSGLLPVTSAARALKLPIPALVATQPYNVLSTPLLDPTDPVAAAGGLIDAAASRVPLLVLQTVALEGPAHAALQAALAARGLTAVTDNVHARAVLATDLDDETYLRSGLGSKKLKELRRQGHRLADEGTVAFAVASAPDAVAPALERFLTLEARGWKGQRGTGLSQDAGDAQFVRAMAADLSARGKFEVAELTLNGTTIASGLVLRQADRAQFFKIAYDETLARLSVGVQLTLEMTRRFIADPTLNFVDSTASAEHPMIDHVWRERLTVGHLYVQTRAGDAVGPALGKLIRLRHDARSHAKRLYHSVRNRLEKKS